MKGPGKFTIEWISRGGPPKQPPNAAFPHGVDVDLSGGREPYCQTALPYPTGKDHVGGWLVRCLACGLSAYITAASRPDDPCSLKVACKELIQ